MDKTPSYVIEMLHITKEFPGIKANDDITLQLKKGENHALLGENGAGKSTLMSVLFGLYQPEAGEIRKNGEKVNITDPNVATALGIGMVHQISSWWRYSRYWIISFWGRRPPSWASCRKRKPAKRWRSCRSGTD